MKTYNNSVVLRNDGTDPSTSNDNLNAGVGVNITVRVASTPTAGQGAEASIFNIADVAIANPTQTDNQGNYTFKVADGLYDIVIAEGTADETILASEEIVELVTPDFINNLSLPYVFDTVADYKAFDTAFPVGKVIKLLDRGAEFTVVSGTGTANTYSIISSDVTSQSIELIIKDKTVLASSLGEVADGVFDNQLVHAHIISLLLDDTIDKVIFSEGVHLYSVSHNWAVSRKIIDCTNNCRFRYTGTDHALILAGDQYQGTAGCYNNFFGMNGRFIIEAPSTAKNGIFCNYYHHCKVRARVAGCGTTYAGALLKFCVVSEFDLHVTVNEEGWYLGAKPEIGINLDSHSGNGTPMSYCTFINPIVEATNIGIQLTQTLGNIFIGGTSEGCTLYGVFASSAARQDRFYGMDFEVNTSADVFCQGKRIEFNSCDSDNLINFSALSEHCIVTGGQHKKLTNDTGAKGNTFANTYYNRFNDGTTFTEVGTDTKLVNVVNVASDESYLNGSKTYNPPSIPSTGVITTTVSVTGLKKEDATTVSFSESQSGIRISASPSGVGVATVYFENVTGGAIDMPEGTLKVYGHRN